MVEKIIKGSKYWFVESLKFILGLVLSLGGFYLLFLLTMKFTTTFITRGQDILNLDLFASVVFIIFTLIYFWILLKLNKIYLDNNRSIRIGITVVIVLAVLFIILLLSLAGSCNFPLGVLPLK